MEKLSNMFGLYKPHQAQSRTISLKKSDHILYVSKHTTTSTKNISNKQYNPLFITFFAVCSLIVIIFSHPEFTQADNLLSPSFEVKMSTINITGGEKSSASYRLTDTVGQTAQGEFNSSGYTIKAGFQYVTTIIPFSFTISDIDLDFGSLVPGTPSILTNVLTVTTGSAFGYTVKAIEDHPLRLYNSLITIADTACDLASPCSISDATVWADNTRYGFGYNVQGDDSVAEFVDGTYYRPFPIQGTDDPVTVMEKSGVTASSSATVKYKVNISGSQAAGLYQNAIQYIATPAF